LNNTESHAVSYAKQAYKTIYCKHLDALYRPLRNDEEEGTITRRTVTKLDFEHVYNMLKLLFRMSPKRFGLVTEMYENLSPKNIIKALSPTRLVAQMSVPDNLLGRPLRRVFFPVYTYSGFIFSVADPRAWNSLTTKLKLIR